MPNGVEYIQLKTGLGAAIVKAVRVDAPAMQQALDGCTSATTYLTAERARILADALLGAANHMERTHAKS